MLKRGSRIARIATRVEENKQVKVKYIQPIQWTLQYSNIPKLSVQSILNRRLEQ